ncbi:MAG: tRNA uridine-5-carboxymethylaminomethyl(34) synthesis GTPase MnmE [Spirochaetales bacterium]|jgi:tRNA modification GTPase|nr:tRNA uridine-5-carboxymethylaminomethyl(34) synthesis GTPase MnmE [Spirochaetales bacterium]
MDEDLFYPQDSIAALATPWGESALAVIRVSGPDSLRLLASVFEPASATGKTLEEIPGHTVHRGVITAPGENGRREIVDDVLAAVYRGPKSFTGEDGAELFCHGSPIIIRRLLALLEEAGFRFAGPGEFTLRAFLNRKLDLTQAEAVNEVVRAKTDRARAIALNRLSGAIEQKINQIKSTLIRLSAAVELRLDYPDDEIEESDKILGEEEVTGCQQELERLLSTYRIGKIYQEGISVVLAGSTNSGKSTLFNRMLREDRAIVSEIHGTTRDYLERFVSVEGIPIKLYDTAGYREQAEGVDAEGMRRTDSIVSNADIILYLVDGESGFTAKDEEFLHGSGGEKRLIPVWNKIDRQSSRCPAGFIPISAKEGDGLEELGRAIADKVLTGVGMVDSGEPIIDSLRQKRLLERALQGIKDFRAGLQAAQPLDVLAVDLKEALDALGEITGEVTSQDILNQIFSQFCVGK